MPVGLGSQLAWWNMVPPTMATTTTIFQPVLITQTSTTSTAWPNTTWTVYNNPYWGAPIMGNPYRNNPYDRYAPPELERVASPAIIRERAELQRRRADQLVADYERRDAERLAASAKAEQLLRRLLDPVQLAAFEAAGSFEVVGSSGARYRITRGRIANIDVLDARGECMHRLCVHPEDPAVPIGDVMAAQLLHLRHHEPELLRIANRHPAPRMGDIRAPAGMMAA